MNLVSIENVVAALCFLIQQPGLPGKEVYIISDDEDPLNSFRPVEMELMRQLGVREYFLPPLPIPLFVLSWAWRLKRRSCTNPARIYAGARLIDAGFRKPVAFGESLRRFSAEAGLADRVLRPDMGRS